MPRSTLHRAIRLPAAALGLLVVAAACGTGGGGGGGAGAAAGVTVTGAKSKKPEISITGEKPPSKLLVDDLVTGDGDEAVAGARVTVHYVGVSWSTEEEFDSSWDRGTPIPLELRGVIPGWEQGIPGMRVGGRRLLIIPPALAYDDSPPPGSGIEPGETLVFVVDLVEAEGGADAPDDGGAGESNRTRVTPEPAGPEDPGAPTPRG